MGKFDATPVPAASTAEDEGEIGSATMRTAETLLRILPMALCVAALVIMLKDSQTNDYGSLSYSDIGAFRYLVHASGVCAGYSLLSAVVAGVPRPSTMSRAWTFFLLDQLLTYVVLAAGVISTAVVYLAYKGDAAITWSQTCGSFSGFCHKATASIAITFFVTLCYAGFHSYHLTGFSVNMMHQMLTTITKGLRLLFFRHDIDLLRCISPTSQAMYVSLKL